MKFSTALLTASCALALAACGSDDRPADADPPSDASVAPAQQGATATTGTQPMTGDPTMPGQTDDHLGPAAAPGMESGPGDASADASAAAAGAGDAPATVTNCETTIEGNDRIQFNVDSITIPADCSEFTINLRHVGSLPVAAMGHNVVVTTTEDYPAVAAEGLTAGAAADYVPEGDDRVIAATEMIGGGESTSVTFSTDDLDAGGDYTFFCSFPGHSAVMRGSLRFSD